MSKFKPLRVCDPPPLYFASQNTEEEFKSIALPIAVNSEKEFKCS